MQQSTPAVPVPQTKKAKRALPPVPIEPGWREETATTPAAPAAAASNAAKPRVAEQQSPSNPLPSTTAPLPAPSDVPPPGTAPLPVGSFYTPPFNSCVPLSNEWKLDVLKQGSLIDSIPLSSKSHFVFGRVSELVDITLDHESVSRRHAVIQFIDDQGDGNPTPYLWDLSSTYGSFINKKRISAATFMQVRPGDQIKFAASTRIYVMEGPEEFRPKEIDKEALVARAAAMRKQQAEAQAKAAAAAAGANSDDKPKKAPLDDTDGGASWGQSEDAEADEDEMDTDGKIVNEDGQLVSAPLPLPSTLTPLQQKLVSKLETHQAKLQNLQNEIDTLQSKEIRQGGLTEGQEKQVAKNEQRIKQIHEEIESVESQLQESIARVTGDRAKTLQHAKGKKGHGQDEDVYKDSDEDDEFFDRTKIKRAVTNKSTSGPVVAAASASSFLSSLVPLESLKTPEQIEKELLKIRNKKNQLTNNLREVHIQLIKAQRGTQAPSSAVDSLDSYMSTLNSSSLTERKKSLTDELSQLNTHSVTLTRLIEQRKGEIIREKYLAGDVDAFKNAAKEEAAAKLAQQQQKQQGDQEQKSEANMETDQPLTSDPVHPPSAASVTATPSAHAPAPPPVASSTADTLNRLKRKAEAQAKRISAAQEKAEAEAASLKANEDAKRAIMSAAAPSSTAASASSSSSAPSKPQDRIAFLARQLEAARSATHRKYDDPPEDDVSRKLKTGFSKILTDGEPLGGGLMVRKRKGDDDAETDGIDSSFFSSTFDPKRFKSDESLRQVQEQQSVDWVPPTTAASSKSQDALRSKFAGRY